MAKLKRLPSQNIIDGLKGKIDFYVYMGLPCARAWPASPGHNRAPAVEAQWDTWATASRLWNTLTPAVQEAWNRLASGTNMSGRDLCTKCYITTAFVFEP